jgi:hypothetical protein
VIKVTMDSEGNIDIKPTFLNVPNGPDSIILRWEAVAPASFPSSGFFNWKAGSGQPAVTLQSADVLQSASYVNDATARRLWRYSINVSGVEVDPEVNNQPPGGGGGMPAGQIGQPGGGQQGGGQQGGGQQGGGGGGQQGGGPSQNNP